MPTRFLQAALFLLLVLMAGKPMAAELNLTQNQLPVALGPYLDHLEDSSGQLKITDIINGNFDWQRSNQSIPTLGMSASAHWFSIVFTGVQVPEDELLLSLASPTLDRVEFYFVQNKQLVKQAVTGDTVPFSDLEFPYRYPIVPFQLSNADQTTVYIRVQSISGVEMQLGLTTAVLLIAEQQADFVFFGAFYTFFILSFCFCAIIYYAWRESQFRGYTLFFGASIVFFLAENGTGRLWLWGDQGDFNNRLAYVSAIAMIASFCLLGQSLNLNNKYRDSVVIVLRLITFATIPLGLYFFMVPIEQITTGNVLMIMYLALTVALTVFVMTGITALQGSRSAVYLFFFLGIPGPCLRLVPGFQAQYYRAKPGLLDHRAVSGFSCRSANYAVLI